MIPEGTELLARCERFVELALARGADQAEAYWEAGANMDVDVEAGRLAGSSTHHAQGGSIRVVKNGRLGFAYFTRPEDAEKTIDRAIEQAGIGPGKGYSLPTCSPVEALAGRWDDQLAQLNVEDAATRAKDLIAGAQETCPDGTMTGGGVGAGWGVEAIASSEGASGWDRTTSMGAGASMVLEQGDGAISVWEAQSAHNGGLDGHAIGAAAGKTAMDLRNAKPAKAGTMDVVLLPDAASELVQGFIGGAVDGDDAMRGRSVWSDALDTRVAHNGLSIIDDAKHPGGIGTTPMDGEGVPTRKMPIIDGGQLSTFLFDSWTAHRHGTKSTGHAQRGTFKATPTTGGNHWILTHDNTRAMDKLLADVDDGYLVESVLGAHTANATTGDFSVTSPNVWRIKSGAIEGACSDVAIGGNLPELLHRLDAVSDAPKHRDGSIMPAVRFRDVQVSV